MIDCPAFGWAGIRLNVRSRFLDCIPTARATILFFIDPVSVTRAQLNIYPIS